MSNEIDIGKIVSHWIKTSDEDFDAVNSLFKSKTYHWALFLGHISTEKLLKAYFVKVKKKHSPPIHNLLRIAEKCELELTEEYKDWLDAISLFNINARYDDFKREFYKQCTKEFTKLWIERINEIREWIRLKL
ncbi:MAG: HEPN domain-containing protein [Bacteroidales bacterium]|nr:HEPN domain-containing protein [Bacteroidales bacterium]